MHRSHEPTPTRRNGGSGTPAAGPLALPRHGTSSLATSLGALAASAARGALAIGMAALVCAACSLAEDPAALVPLPPSPTGPILLPSYVPEPEAILASMNGRLMHHALPAAREGAQPSRGPDGTFGGG